MQTVLDARFDEGRLPPGWFDEARHARISGSTLYSGRVWRPKFLLPDGAWRQLRLEAWMQSGAHSSVEFGNERVLVLVNLANGRHCVTAYNGKTLAANVQPLRVATSVRRVSFTFDHGAWQAQVDGQTVLTYRQPTGDFVAGLMTFTICNDCVVHRVRVSVADPPSTSQPARPDPQQDFHLEVTVDFPDDLSYAPYTPAMLEHLFAEYATWGVRRCHWIFDEKDHWWSFFREPCYSNYLKTRQHLDGDIFSAAVAAAHRHGIELYGVFKPFEMGYMLHTLGEGTPEARHRGRFSRIGGVIERCADHVVSHRELMTCRKPDAFGPAENDVFTCIELVSDRASSAAFAAEQVRLFTSDDNNTYRPYEGPVEVEESVEERTIAGNAGALSVARPCRVIRLTGLQISSRFLAVAVPGHGASFGNVLGDLLRVYGEKGLERRITLGIVPRAGRLSYDIRTAAVSDSRGLDFCRFGIEFDNCEGTPSSCRTGYDAMTEWHALDGKHGFLGIARGKDRDAVAVMSPAFKETRHWWLEWVREILEAGADGVEMRVRNHQTHLSWGEFGFEAPVRDEFMRRYGVDLWTTDDFDRAAWRRLRGDDVTQFYREAKALVSSFGRRMGLHISRTMDVEPQQGASMEIHFNWRAWLDEGLADSVTAKEVWPGTVFASEILSHAQPRNVPVIFSPYANNLWRLPGGADVCAHRIRLARECGFSGFQLYENCSVMRARADGELEMQQPALRALFRSQR